MNPQQKRDLAHRLQALANYCERFRVLRTSEIADLRKSAKCHLDEISKPLYEIPDSLLPETSRASHYS